MGHQVNFELNVERQIYEHRIQELETELINQQNEVLMWLKAQRWMQVRTAKVQHISDA